MRRSLRLPGSATSATGADSAACGCRVPGWCGDLLGVARLHDLATERW